MSENEATTQQRPPADPGPRRLRRSSRDRVIGGVCGGLADHTGVDPVIFRIGFVVLALVNGLGLLVYLIAWLVLPAEDRDDRSAAGVLAVVLVGVIVVLGLLALLMPLGMMWSGHMPGMWFDPVGPGQRMIRRSVGMSGVTVLWALLLAGVGIALWQRRERHAAVATRPGPSSAAAVPSDVTASEGEGTRVPTAEPVEPPPPPAASATGGPHPPTPPPAPRSPLGRLTFGAVLLVLGTAVLLDSLGIITLTAARGIALALTVLGAGLIVGAWWGRARWLVFPGVLLVLALLATGIPGMRAWGPTGNAYEVATSVAELRDDYHHGTGDLTIDLSGVDFSGERRTIRATLGMGVLRIHVPETVSLVVRGRVGVGELVVPARGSMEGVDLSREARVAGIPGGGSLHLDAQVGLGSLMVSRIPSAVDDPPPTPLPEREQPAEPVTEGAST